MAAMATRCGPDGWGKGDLEVKGNLGENKGECNLEVKVVGDGEGFLEFVGKDDHKEKGEQPQSPGRF